MKNFLKKINKNEDGVFTLEATILFPIILMITMSFIFFSLVMFQESSLHYAGNMIAERSAYVWDNSFKGMDGEFDKYSTFDDGDGLYWRTFDNQYLSKFGLDLFSSPADYTYDLDTPFSDNGDNLPKKKLTRVSSDVLPAGASGTIRYDNGALGSEIVVEMESPLNLPTFVRELVGISSIEVEVSHTVVEPPEFMRSIDLVTYIGGKFQKYSSYIEKFKDLSL